MEAVGARVGVGRRWSAGRSDDELRMRRSAGPAPRGPLEEALCGADPREPRDALPYITFSRPDVCKHRITYTQTHKHTGWAKPVRGCSCGKRGH